MFGELVPWDHANYGLDPSWVRCAPYAQTVHPGDRVTVDVVVTDHSKEPRTSACRALLPEALGGSGTAWSEATLDAGAEKRLSLAFRVSPNAAPGRYAVPVDLRHGPWNLPRFAEAVLDVAAK
jgi:hypothetical protein